MLGGTYGHIRLIDLKQLFSNIYEHIFCELKVIKSWRAHTQAIVGATFVETHNLILTCSKDTNIRLWTKTGILFLIIRFTYRIFWRLFVELLSP